MITELPYDIWRYIFSLLHPKTIRQLRFVNTLFYNALLDDYHRITEIGYPYPGIYYPPLWYVNSGITLDLVFELSVTTGILEVPNEQGCS